LESVASVTFWGSRSRLAQLGCSLLALAGGGAAGLVGFPAVAGSGVTSKHANRTSGKQLLIGLSFRSFTSFENVAMMVALLCNRSQGNRRPEGNRHPERSEGSRIDAQSTRSFAALRMTVAVGGSPASVVKLFPILITWAVLRIGPMLRWGYFFRQTAGFRGRRGEATDG
jgi:hypothetical protein